MSKIINFISFNRFNFIDYMTIASITGLLMAGHYKTAVVVAMTGSLVSVLLSYRGS